MCSGIVLCANEFANAPLFGHLKLAFPVRFKPTESAYLYRVARASLGETRTHLEGGRRRGYWTDDEFDKADAVSLVALKVTTGLLNDRLRVIEEEKKNKAKGNRNTGR